jgi:hypothetical protein
VSVGQNLGCERFDGLLVRHVGRVDPGLAAQLLNRIFGGGDARVSLLVSSQHLPLRDPQKTSRLACTRMTSAPASASPTATAWPMPRVQPVMTAVWPWSENTDALIFKIYVYAEKEGNNNT